VEPSTRAWFESDSFWTDAYPYMFSEASFVAAAESVAQLAALAGISSGAVLDLCCGPGRYAVPLAKAGFMVTGVDRTAWLLARARERSEREGVSVEWVEQDMRAFCRPGAFDLALNLFTSFGYFDDEAENLRVLENVYASLKPGGAFVLDHIGKETLAAKLQPTRSDAFEDGTVLVQRVSVIDDWSRVSCEWLLIQGDRVVRHAFRHWLYSAHELRRLLKSVGFAEVAFYGSFDRVPYGPQAQRLVAVARKACA